MNQDYQQDPYQQAGQGQPWQSDQDQYSAQQTPLGPGTPQRQFGQAAQQGQQGRQGMLSDVRQMAEQQIDQVIDQFGNKVPGGSQYTQQAKDAIGGILDNLEQEVENRIGNLGGGMLGGGGGQAS
ncbi:MAG: hypothetical protein JOZ18_00600 [Chloroflexi bacterium]|nr:hypothetical protein [Chloroflexota bacterium]